MKIPNVKHNHVEKTNHPCQIPVELVERFFRAEDAWSGLRESARDFRATSTPAEARLWQALRGRKLGGARFRRQHAIGRFLVDFYCAEATLVIEVDGPVHRQQVEQDAEREREVQE
jgi:very-short-patch-repair endonuclease